MNFETVFNLIWSIGAIGLGLVGIFYTDWYVNHTIRWSKVLYGKTKFPLYKLQMEETNKPYMRATIKAIGFVFLVLGIMSLLGKL